MEWAGEGDNGRVADPESPQPRHGRLTLTQRGVRVGFALAAVAALGATAFVVGTIATGSARTVGTSPADPPAAAVPVATALPVPSQTGVTPASCDDPTVAAAVTGGTDAEIIAAFGGGAAFRQETGLAADVTACDAGCAALQAFGGTREAEWVAANAWRFGFVIRYEDGATGVTGSPAEIAG